MPTIDDIESLYEVWEITEWRNGAVYKTRNTGETRWLTEKELKENHPIETDIIFSVMPMSFTGQTVRTRKS
jgi:hypothetical protein